MSRFGNALIVIGVLLLGYAGLWQLGLAPGARVTLPPPVALPRTPTSAPLVAAAATPLATATIPRPTAVDEPATALAKSVPTVPAALAAAAPRVPQAPLPAAPDAADRKLDAQLPAAGYAVRLAIPAINLDTEVQQGGIVQDDHGNPVWQTLPFVAVHYGDLTALVGARGNAVIAGHVVTLREGNVFRFLYQIDLDDEIQVWDDHEREHDFRVVDVKLVPPTDLSPMGPTADRTLTLITCGGTFDPIKREFSDRLIVTAKPL
jgi:LPXTG-site transpeptidase (sortase) family protein